MYMQSTVISSDMAKISCKSYDPTTLVALVTDMWQASVAIQCCRLRSSHFILKCASDRLLEGNRGGNSGT